MGMPAATAKEWTAEMREQEILERSIEWRPNTVVPPLVIDLSELFKQAIDD